MREIKFRAWQKHHKRMLEVAKIDFKFNIITADYGEQTIPRFNTFSIENFILMQYTGLTDKNGTEIYEGDILQSQIGEKHIWQVIFDDGCFEIDREVTKRRKRVHEKELCSGENIEWYELVNVGNIYENPELLGK